MATPHDRAPLNSDRDGFLLPDRRLSAGDLSQGIQGVKRNTDAILALLRTRTRSLDRSGTANPNSRQRPAGAAPGASAAPRPAGDRISSPAPGGAGRGPAAEVADEVRQFTRQQAQQVAERDRNEAARRAREGAGGRNQVRDASGRFGSGGGSAGEGGEDAGEGKGKSLWARMKNFFSGRSGGPALDGADKVDPVIESAKEMMGMVGGAVGALKTTGELGRAVIGKGFGSRKKEDAQAPWFKRVLQQLKLMRRDDSEFHRAELRLRGEPQGGGGGSSIIADVLKLIFSPVGVAIVAALTGVWMGFGKQITGAWSDFIGGVKDKWDTAVAKFMGIWEPIAKFFSDKFGLATATAAAVGNKANEAVKQVTGVDVKAGTQKIGDSISSAKDKAVASLGEAKDWAAGKIKRLVSAKGKDRDYERDDGGIEQRRDGSVSWRNNNPGNLKFAYKGSADQTDKSGRSKDAALTAARKRYGNDLIDLDQFGNAIFSTPEAGRAAQAKLLKSIHGGKTVEEMLPKYAVDDYSGKANHAAYATSIHKAAQASGVDIRGKKIGDLTDVEMNVLLDGMKKVEGFKVGRTSVVPGVALPSIGAGPTPTMTGAMPPPGMAPGSPRIASISVPAQTPPPAAPQANAPIPLGSKPPLEVTVRNGSKLAGQDIKDRRLSHIATGGMSSN